MSVGRPITRRGYLTIDPFTAPAANTVLIVRGTQVPDGDAVEVMFSTSADRTQPPVSGTWYPANASVNGAWAYGLGPGLPAGTYVAWVRFRDRPATRVASPVFTVV